MEMNGYFLELSKGPNCYLLYFIMFIISNKHSLNPILNLIELS